MTLEQACSALEPASGRGDNPAVLSDEDRSEILDDIADEALNDHVGLWTIPWSIERLAPGTDATAVKLLTLAILRELLEEGRVRLGRFHSGGKVFEEWELSVEQSVARVDQEWSELGRVPNIGEIAWMVAFSEQPSD